MLDVEEFCKEMQGLLDSIKHHTECIKKVNKLSPKELTFKYHGSTVRRVEPNYFGIGITNGS